MGQDWRRQRSGLVVPVTIALITLAGTTLRIAAAHGDLWLDEIWSFRLLDTAPSYATIVLALPYDTNHVLTTLWLALVGPAAPVLLVRLPAVVFGSLCVPVAARIGARHSPVTGLAAAAVFAFAYPFVHFGSEARGYAGLILAVLLALDALERYSAENALRRSLFVFALAIAFGTFSHLTMIEATAVLCATALLRRQTPVRPVLLAAAAGTLLPALCFGISLTAGSFHRGLVSPFSLDSFESGLGRMAEATIGLPDGPFDPIRLAAILVGVAVAVIAALAFVDRDERIFPALAILGLPILHVVLQVPNQQYPRFHLTAAIALALLAAAIWGRAWRQAKVGRLIAIATAAAFAIGQSATLAAFLSQQRGHYADAVAFMARGGPATVTVLPSIQAGETGATIRWYASRSGAPVTPVTACERPADWLVVVHLPNETAETSSAEDGCHHMFTRRATFPAYGLSGFTWVVFHRTEP